MKLLIMVLGCKNQPFNVLHEWQKKTWDSVVVDGVETVYYFGGNKTELKGKDLTLRCNDTYYFMHWKFKLALDYIKDMDFDYVFRTNASTYVNKQAIYNWIKENNPEYAGLINGNYATGYGICLSKKATEILRDNLPEQTKYTFPDEDVVIGDILREKEINPTLGPMIDIYNHQQKTFIPADYYRCKTSISSDFDRVGDIAAFKHIHKHLTK